MRGLIVLAVLFGIAFADDGCVCEVHSRPRRAAGWGNYAGARIDAQYARIHKLAKQVDKLAHEIGEEDDHHFSHDVHSLEVRLEHIEGDDCDEHQFSCGRKSGQCISELLVCDHVDDCENGHDEDEEHVCHNEAPIGRSWSGHAIWHGCINRHYSQMSLLITGNDRKEHFPSHMWVDAVIIDKWTEDHEEHTKTWNTHGYYDYAHTRIVLEAPEHSTKGIAMTCEDAGDGLADCHMFRESDHYDCGHVMLVRAV